MILTWLRRRLPEWTPWWFDRIVFKIDDASWWLIYRFNRNHQYHIIRTGLKPGYYDTDDLLEAAILTLFFRFVEVERDGPDEIKANIAEFEESLVGDTIVGKEMLERQVAADREVVELYDWFKVEKPVRENSLQSLCDIWGEKCNETDGWKEPEGCEPNAMQLGEIEHGIYEDTSARLLQIIKLRGNLWT